ncbi:MAG TPA: ribokinase [Roseiarcus sp.]|nr:ribokinase [Roseiarcus sp.]
MAQRPRIGVIGSTNMDLTTTVVSMPVWGETVLASHFETSFGGKGANQAIAAAKLGADVVMVTNLGDDALGESALRNFASSAIDTSHVRRIANQSTGTATILVDGKSGDNAILIVAGANGDLSSADVGAASEALKRCDLILLQLEVQLETAYEAIRFARRNGLRTVLNPAPARRNLDMAVVRQASFLIPNESELAILTDMPVESEDEIAAAARRLVNEGVETVIVTLGARGSLVATGASLRRIAPIKVQAVDTTGAGDAFIGSFARYLAGGLSLDAALVEATRYAAFSVTRHGAQKSFATEAEFAAFQR